MYEETPPGQGPIGDLSSDLKWGSRGNRRLQHTFNKDHHLRSGGVVVATFPQEFIDSSSGIPGRVAKVPYVSDQVERLWKILEVE